MKPWVWLGIGGAAAATALVVAGVAEASADKSASPMLQVITDAATVKQAQTVMSTATADSCWVGPVYGPPNDPADGNPAQPDFVTAVRFVQKLANAILEARPTIRTQLPANFPQSLRQDGVLDYATYAILTVIASGG